MQNATIKLRDLRKEYVVDGRNTHALAGVHLEISPGTIFGLIGHSGAGKSTLLRCINLLERPTGGSVEIAGIELTQLTPNALRLARRNIGMIFQHFNLLGSATVYDNIALPMRLWGEPETVIRERTDRLIARLGLVEHRSKFPSQLSGGQKQRVGIGRALGNAPHILLCDEATSALDPQTTEATLGLLRELHAEFGLTMVVVTHDMNVIRDLCDRVAILDRGTVIEQGRVDDVFLSPQHAITKELVGQARKLVTPPEIAARYARMPAAERSETTVVYVSVLGGGVLQPILSDLLAHYQVRFNILEGQVSSIKGTNFGQLLVEMRAATPILHDAVGWLRQLPGVHVDILL